MDDGRAVLHPFRHGWRWVEGGLYFQQDWKKEDSRLSTIKGYQEDYLGLHAGGGEVPHVHC